MLIGFTDFELTRMGRNLDGDAVSYTSVISDCFHAGAKKNMPLADLTKSYSYGLRFLEILPELRTLKAELNLAIGDRLIHG
jgi:hypothetical protein